MKTSKNIYLIPVLVFLLVMLQRAWLSPEANKQSTSEASTTETTKIGGLGKIKTFDEKKDVIVHTDKMTVRISQDGGAVTGVSLNKFAQSLTDQAPFTLLSNNPQHLYLAQTGMSGDADLRFSTTAKSFTLNDTEDSLVVPMVAKDDYGRTFTKTFKFLRGKYHFEVASSVTNDANTSWSGIHYSRLILRHDSEKVVSAKNIPVDIDAPKPGWFTFSTYTGPAYFTDAKPYVKLPFVDVEKKPLKQTIDTSGWIAMQQRYFLCALIPQEQSPHSITATWQSGTAEHSDTAYRNLFNFSSVSPTMVLAPGEKTTKSSIVYAGPEKPSGWLG